MIYVFEAFVFTEKDCHKEATTVRNGSACMRCFPSFFDMTQNVLKRVLTLFRHQTSFDKKSRKNLAAFYSINACSMPARRGRPFTLVFTVTKWQK